jgi:hypothetical protein
MKGLCLACENILPVDAVEDGGDLSLRYDTDWRHGASMVGWRKERRKEKRRRAGPQGRSTLIFAKTAFSDAVEANFATRRTRNLLTEP